jgi:putative membrane protein
MLFITKILIGIIAFEHLYILYMEMFAWETLGKKTFKGALPDELFKPTKTLAANQGLYNGFLSAGLIWTFFIDDEIWKKNIALFFIGCIIVAGLYGTFTASKKIFFTQALPAIVTMILLLLTSQP